MGVGVLGAGVLTAGLRREVRFGVTTGSGSGSESDSDSGSGSGSCSPLFFLPLFSFHSFAICFALTVASILLVFFFSAGFFSAVFFGAFFEEARASARSMRAASAARRADFLVELGLLESALASSLLSMMGVPLGPVSGLESEDSGGGGLG